MGDNEGNRVTSLRVTPLKAGKCGLSLYDILILKILHYMLMTQMHKDAQVPYRHQQRGKHSLSGEYCHYLSTGRLVVPFRKRQSLAKTSTSGC